MSQQFDDDRGTEQYDPTKDTRSQEFDWETLFRNCGEDATPERSDVVRELTASATSGLARWICDVRLKPGADAIIGRRAIAAFLVLNPTFFRTPPRSTQKILRLLGCDARTIKKLLPKGVPKNEQEGERLAAKARSTHEFDQEGPSLTSVAYALGFTAPNLSTPAAEFSRVFGVTNVAQRHDWRRKSQTNPHPPENQNPANEPLRPPQKKPEDEDEFDVSRN